MLYSFAHRAIPWLVFVQFTASASAVSAQVLPGPPEALTASPMVGTVQVEFRWQAPLTGGLPEGYQLEIGTTPGGTDRGVLDVGNVFVHRTSLTAGQFYARVRARNAAGVGPPSLERSVLVTCGQTDTGPPRDIAYRWNGTHLELAFSRPAGILEGVTGYRLEIGASADVLPYAVDLPLAQTWIVIDVRQLPFLAATFYVRVQPSINARPAKPHRCWQCLSPPCPLRRW